MVLQISWAVLLPVTSVKSHKGTNEGLDLYATPLKVVPSIELTCMQLHLR